MTNWATNTQHFECAYCGAEKTVRHYEDMDYERCEHRKEWLCWNCATKHPSNGGKCQTWWAEIGIAAALFIMMGCAGAKHYVPDPTPYDPCENIQFPFRLPTDVGLDIINSLRKEGKCEDLKTYLKTINQGD